MKEVVAVNVEFVKLTNVGQAVAGRLVSRGENKQGEYVVFEPIFVRNGKTAAWKKYAVGAVGLSTDLLRKIKPDHTGKAMWFEFDRTEPVAGQPSPMKLFKVFELEKDEAIDLNNKAEVVEGKINADKHAPFVDEGMPF